MNTSTLEQRLQNVARTFVSSRGPRQGSQPPSRPGSAGLSQQMPHINGFTASSTQGGFPQSFVAGNGIPGQQQRQQLQSQHQNQQQHPHQQQQRPASASNSAQLQGQLQARPDSALGHSSTAGSMPMASQPAANAQQSPSQSRNQMDLASPTLGSADTNMGLAGQQQQQQAAMMRAHQAPSAGGPVMSNGKPALLRGAAARDGNGWAQGPAMVSTFYTRLFHTVTLNTDAIAIDCDVRVSCTQLALEVRE